MLNAALASELACILRYRRCFGAVDGRLAAVIRNEFLDYANEKQDQVERMAERIVQLGGEPDFDLADIASRSNGAYEHGASLADMMETDLIAVRMAVVYYGAMVKALQGKDSMTRRLVKSVIAVQVEQAGEMTRMIGNLRGIVAHRVAHT